MSDNDGHPGSDGQAPIVNRRLTRRQLLAAGAIGGVGLATGGSALALQSKGGTPATPLSTHHDMMAVGELRPGSFDPSAFLTRFDMGRVSRLASGPRGVLSGMDVQRPGAGPDTALH
jgi:hypothetical protein